MFFRLTPFAHVNADSRRYRSGPSFQILQTCTNGMFALITSTVSGILPIQTWSGREDLFFRLAPLAAETRTPSSLTQSVLSNPTNMHQWHVCPNYPYCIWHSTNTNLVGTRGFEPPTPSTPYWCASQTAPRPVFLYFRVIQMISKVII